MQAVEKADAFLNASQVMSCPSGCNNGGGQIPAAIPGKAAATALLENVSVFNCLMPIETFFQLSANDDSVVTDLMIVLQVATIYREGMLQQPPNIAGGAPHGDDAMHVEDAGVSAGANSGEGADGHAPPQILGQLLEGGVSPVEVARLAQSGRRQRLGAHCHLSRFVLLAVFLRPRCWQPSYCLAQFISRPLLR